MPVPDIIHIVFLFMLGACIGSFLNVVVWRLPRVEVAEDTGVIQYYLASFKFLSNPPSHCPQCNNRLKWYDNIPIFGWIKLGGKCRFCRKPISIGYPIVELITAMLFAGYYVAYYIMQARTCCPQPHVLGFAYDSMGIGQEITNPRWIWSESWPIYLLYMTLISGLLAASLIDAELFIIPTQIPWVLALIGFVVHAIVDQPAIPGALNLVGSTGPPLAALSAGGTVGLTITIILWLMGIMPTSFVQGEPMLEVDRARMLKEIEKARQARQTWDQGPVPPEYTTGQIRSEISKEMLFLLPAMLMGGGFLAATMWMPSVHLWWHHLVLSNTWLNGLLGSLLGAMVGGFVVWMIRILGTIAFRRVAMGLGDVHLMFGVGAILGAPGAVITFFIAPFFSIVRAVYMLMFRKGRELPLGPYLSMAAAAVMLFYCPIIAYLQPGLEGLLIVLSTASIQLKLEIAGVLLIFLALLFRPWSSR
jgi:leader peptidase (prepilin peptidase)/N-methyltransferase